MRKIRFDGGGGERKGAAFVVLVDDAVQSRHSTPLPGYAETSNEAEWCALILALDYANRQGWVGVDVVGDSKLVVMQVRNKWRVKSENLLRYHRLGRALMLKGHHHVSHQHREHNRAADAAVREGLRLWGSEM